ncbi:Aste57867_14077 [Aphanomyces stellatus]|uniref:glucan endo-1,3-beta-D-glucosidase n=1 Tax=Aphanomyces stellatus TaxID=120398 RepID=A0A485KZR9_9STRA|nr:hypothetical protein As57867_014026 [Aphanomyces stellatus]VFT90905.1 Aste57867_14077 [Aphanomyces stellatus]
MKLHLILSALAASFAVVLAATPSNETTSSVLRVLDDEDEGGEDGGDGGSDTGGDDRTLQNVMSVFDYNNQYRRGSYDKVTALQGCQKENKWSEGPIAPYHEDVSFVFRGPMDIYNIAIFSTDGDRGWVAQSTYNRDSGANNMVFMNNANPQKFNGLSPQGYASADGVDFSREPVHFGGRLEDGRDPDNQWGGPGITTGAEVNIMRPDRCDDGSCDGYYDPAYGLQGWSGSKVFAAKVKMDRGGIPAIWMLNAQVIRANQYGCNCRGMADPGGCGEFDIAEAIYHGTDTLATHDYYLNLKPSANGHDTWAIRPIDGVATIVGVWDIGTGVIKVLQMSGDDFDFFDRDVVSYGEMNREVIFRQ